MEPIISNSSDLDRSAIAWLAAEAMAGREAALSLLLRRLQPRALAYIRRLVGPTDAPDVWQETAMAICAGLKRLRDTSSARAWCFSLAHHKAMDCLRRRRPETREDDLPELVAPDSDLDQTLFVQQQLSRLTPEQQSVLYWFYHLGLSLAEIASALDVSPGAARTRLFRARLALRQLIEGDHP